MWLFSTFSKHLNLKRLLKLAKVFEIFGCEDGKAVTSVAWRNYGHPMFGNAQDKVEWGSEQHGLVECVCANGKGV